MTIHAHRLGKGMIFFVALDGAFAHEVAAFHALVLLRLRNRVVAVGDFAGHAAEGAHAVRAAERVGIETHTIHQGGDFLASVAQGDGERVVGVAWSDDCCGFDGVNSIGNFHDVGDQVVVDVVTQFLGYVSENIEVICLNAELLGSGGADEDRIVPSNLGDKIRSLEEPGIVRVAAIIHARALQEDQLQAIGLGGRGLREVGGGGGVERGLDWREGRIGLEAIAEEGVPCGRVGGFGNLRECCLNQGRPDRSGRAVERIKNLELRTTTPEREDHRLHRSVGAVKSANIAPGFEEMGGRNMPAADFGGFVLEQSEMDGIGDLLEKFGETQFGRSAVGGVAAENEEAFYLAGINRFREIANAGSGRSIGFDRCDSGADVAEGAVDRVDQNLHRGGRERAGDDNRATAILGEVGRAFFDPLGIKGRLRSGNGVGDGGQVGVATGFGEDQSELTGKFAHVGDLQAQAVVSHAAGDRVVVLDDIKAVHRSAFLVGIAASGKALRVTNAGFDRIQEIAIDCQNNIGAAEIRNEANIRAKRSLSGRFSRSSSEGIIFRPKEIWKFSLQVRAEAVASGRTNRFGQNGEALTIAGSHGFHEDV